MLHPSILITGPTGLLGSACLFHQIERHGADQIAVITRPQRSTACFAAKNVAAIPLDLFAPDLGIAPRLYHALAASVRSIIHCAADIRFGISLEESRRTNVRGTENLLRFAAHCPRLEKFAHISTVYVAGGRSAHILEQPAQPGPFYNPYPQSKFEAESAVLRAMSTLPAAIYRFSTMIYSRALARVAQFNYFHQLLRLARVNPLHAIPAIRDARIDLIPSDWAAHVFDTLFEERFEPSQIVHICAGPERSLTVSELFDLTFDVFGRHRKRPRIISLEELNESAHCILTTPSRRQMWQSLSHFLPHMNVMQTFDTYTLSNAASHCKSLGLPDMRSVVLDVLHYCLATDWGAHEARQIQTAQPEA